MRFTIKTKLAVAFGMVLTFLAISGFFGVTRLAASNQRMADFETGPFTQVQRVQALEFNIVDQARLMFRGMNMNTDQQKSDMYQQFSAQQSEFDKLLKAYKEVASVDGAAMAQIIDRLKQKYFE